MRLRSHYFLLAFAIVIPVAVFCGIALRMLQHAQHDSAIKRIEEATFLTAQVIDADIFRAQSVLQVLAHSHALASGDLAGFYKQAQAASATPGGWIILYGTDGQQLVNTRRPFGIELPKRPDPEAVEQMLASGRGQVTGIKYGAAIKSNFVMVETPITSGDGRRYVIGQAFSPAFFAHSFSGRAIPSSWRVAILDRNGVFIARSERADELVGRKVRPQTLAGVSQAHTGVFRHVAGSGIEVYDAYTHSRLSEWIIMIGAPVAEVDEAVWRSVSFITAGLVLALLAALTLTILGGRQLVAVVKRASDAAAALGRGDILPVLPRSTIRELDGLNDAIREAGTRLQDEIESRAAAEAERNDLLVLEKQARAHAEGQNAAKDEFLAMLGHELRNPLSAVASAVAVLDRDPPPASAQRAREVLRRQTGHLRKMVDDLLEVNRALMGKLTLDTEPVDLSELVRRCIDTLHAGGRTGGFDFRYAGEAAIVDGDPVRLQQVVDNILDNAVKYSPGGGVVDVAVKHEGGRAVLTVRDHGQGIAPELLPTVFEVFVQGSQSLQRSAGGLGIGLSLVRRLVGMHGGSVTIDSAGAGQGTLVTVSLACIVADAVAAPASVQASVARRRVLLVEDNADAREMMTMLLELQGCEVLSADNGASAIALAQGTTPELAFIDIGLPGMDGYAVARAFKADPRTAAVRLIALTGYGSENDRQLAHSAGFQHHFTKPIRLEDLQAALA